MSLIVPIDTDPTFEPKAAVALPERLISGSPTFKTWAQDLSKDETIKNPDNGATADEAKDTLMWA